MPHDWSQLPADLLELISEKITTVPDHLRFRSVCSHWRSAAPRRPRHLAPRRRPWLMLPGPARDGRHNPRLFFDLLNGSYHTVDLPPQTSRSRFCGSAHGWLVLQNWPSVSLLNPVTRDQIRLPRLTTLSHRLCFPRFEGHGREHLLRGPYPLPFTDHRLWRASILKPVLSSPPSSSSDCVVMAVVEGREFFLAFCKLGGESWTVVEELDPSEGIVDLSYHRGKFCTVSGRGRVTFFDPGPPWKAVVYTTELHRRENMCLAENSPGGLLMVAWDFGTFTVLELCFSDGQPRWLKVSSIGDGTIFLQGYNNQCFVLSASNFGGRRNRIYYTYHHHGRRVGSYDIKSDSIGDGRVHTDISGLCLSLSSWPRPIWITPSLC